MKSYLDAAIEIYCAKIAAMYRTYPVDEHGLQMVSDEVRAGLIRESLDDVLTIRDAVNANNLLNQAIHNDGGKAVDDPAHLTTEFVI